MKRWRKRIVSLILCIFLAAGNISGAYVSVPAFAIAIPLAEALFSLLLSFGVSYMTYDMIEGLANDPAGSLDDDEYQRVYSDIERVYNELRLKALEEGGSGGSDPNPDDNGDGEPPDINLNIPVFEALLGEIIQDGKVVWDDFQDACSVFREAAMEVLSDAYDAVKPYFADEQYDDFVSLQRYIPDEFYDYLVDYPYYVVQIFSTTMYICMFKYPTALYLSKHETNPNYVEGSLPNGSYLAVSCDGKKTDVLPWFKGYGTWNPAGYASVYKRGYYIYQYDGLTNMKFFDTLEETIAYNDQNKEQVVDYELYPSTYNPHTVWGTPELEQNGLKNGKLELPLNPQNINVPSSDQYADLARQIQQALQNGTAQDVIPGYVEQLQTDLATNPDPQPQPDPNPSPTPEPSPTPTPDNPSAGAVADLRMIFPFCIPFDLVHLFEAFDADPVAPVFQIPFKLNLKDPFSGKQIFNVDYTIKVDMADYETVIVVFRIFQIVTFLIALMLITRSYMIKG